MTTHQRIYRALAPVLIATAGLPWRYRLDRLRGAAKDARVTPKLLLREIARQARRRSA